MARERIFQIRLNDKEWERLRQAVERQEKPAAQLFREWLKTLDTEAQAG